MVEKINEEPAAELIRQYVQIRDFIDVETKKFQEHCAKYRERMEQIEGKLLEKLNALGAGDKQSIKTDFGTAYKSTIVQPKIVDRDAYLNTVMDNYDTFGAGMLQLREPRKEAIDSYMAENNDALPPGVEISSFIRVNVRRGS